ncbi:LLM class flavin-dependent oxidoreductase [Tsukamurella soli]|uniref:LLM class flavin-dependent oxidoreductase n=1 Tax=Tsukamurella soli TaxID=644556 RepID=A0ABP8JB54_9ACTN
MRFGIVVLPQFSWPEARRRWSKAEQLGFDTAWTYDHLSWRSLADQPWSATVPTLVGAALVTERIRLGTFVTSPNFRHPVPFAKDIATLDEMSGGRVTLGIGAGGTGFDAYVLGERELTGRERFARYAEFVAGLDTLLRFEPDGGGAVSFDGDWFTAVSARMVGEPAQRPRMPFVLAGNGPKGIALAARRGQGWVTTGPEGATADDWWAAVARLGSRLDGELAAAGRDGERFDRYLSIDSGGTYSLSNPAYLDDTVGRAAELGFTDLVLHWPRDGEPYAGTEDALDDFAARYLS